MAEVENIAIEEARELVSNQLLWPLVRDFLWDFEPQVHPSWVEDLFSRRNAETLSEKSTLGGLCDSTALREMKSPRIKRYILSLIGVEPCFHTFPKDDGSRLLLLDGATLESILKWFGALACADALRRVTEGATVRELKASLPGIYPEVFGYTMYFGSLEAGKFGSLEKGNSGSGEIGKFGGPDVENVGCGLMLQSLSSLSAPLMHRLKLKLPKGMLDTESQSAFASKLPNLQASIFKLLKLKFPEAYKLCCS